MRRAALVVTVGLVLAVLGSPRAEACGFWSMQDQEKGLDVGWLINAASIEKTHKRLGALYLDLDAPHGIRVAQGHTVVFDIQGNRVLRYGKAIGKLDKDDVTFGSHTYKIELTDMHEDHSMRTWKLAVHRGDILVVTSDNASALCAAVHQDMTEDQAANEVRRRVIYYLAWREAGM